MPDSSDYCLQLKNKTDQTLTQFAPYLGDDIALDVVPSPPLGYRMRAEFRIWHENGESFYAMHDPSPPHRVIKLDTLAIAHSHITMLMPKLLEILKRQDRLKRKLFQCEFLTSTLNEMLVSLIYHAPLDDEWETQAKVLANELSVNIVGRSKGQKRIVGTDHVYEAYQVGERTFRYQQIESSFTQPNAVICQAMLNWADNLISPTDSDFLELYCGNGNFTLPLASKFRQVLATEISKTSIYSALHNCEINQVKNIEFVRMSSEDFGQALKGVRPFHRLRHLKLEDYNFSTVLVDPPRAGLDTLTCELIAQFDNIIYISCNPDTLERDLKNLLKSHRISNAALFDQFPHTAHREMGVFLQKDL